MEKAQRILDVARERHERRVAKIRAQIDVLENKRRVDDERWKKESSRLEASALIGGTGSRPKSVAWSTGSIRSRTRVCT